MRAVPTDELIKWSATAGIVEIDPRGYLRLGAGNRLGMRIAIPQESRGAAAVAQRLVSIEGEGEFYGAFMWFTNWDIGTPNIEECGLRVLEQMRRGYGVTSSIDNAPGQLFRSDERSDAAAFLCLPMFFGWDAYFMPHGTRYFAFVRNSGSLFLVTAEERVFERLWTAFEGYGPVEEVPSYLRE